MRVNMAKNKVKKVKQADVEQKIEIYWKEFNNKTMLAVEITKGSKKVVILKEPKYLKELRDHLQTVAKFGLRRNII
jgi:flagellar hook assembly protein FlgD